jgi:predicted transcriptional regulator
MVFDAIWVIGHNGEENGRRFLVRCESATQAKMSRIKVTVGGKFEKETGRRFADAWRRAERGEKFRERHLTFENWNTLAGVLTGKRMELLRYVRRHDVASVRALAKALERDYSNVHADVQALAGAGLLDTTGGRVRADYDVIDTRIAL